MSKVFFETTAHPIPANQLYVYIICKISEEYLLLLITCPEKFLVVASRRTSQSALSLYLKYLHSLHRNSLCCPPSLPLSLAQVLDKACETVQLVFNLAQVLPQVEDVIEFSQQQQEEAF